LKKRKIVLTIWLLVLTVWLLVLTAAVGKLYTKPTSSVSVSEFKNGPQKQSKEQLTASTTVTSKIPKNRLNWDSRSLQVEATAYTRGPESTGKQPGDPDYGITFSGLPAAPGVCAVDPTVIPLGSILFVPEYGYAVALDTGGAIKGTRIDVYFEKETDALKWGRRQVKISVYPPQF